MGKFETLDYLLLKNKGFLKTSDALEANVSKPYFSEYVKERGLERVAHGLYMSQEAWEDGMYVIQTRYPLAVFSHETALYLLNLAGRESIKYTLTLKSGANATGLTTQGVKVYKVRESLFDEGITEAKSPGGHVLRAYNAERTICDLCKRQALFYMVR